MLDHQTLLELFEKADQILSEKGIIGEIALYGSSAFVFAFSERSDTQDQDIDAYLAPKEEVVEALKEAAKELRLDFENEDWISSAVFKYVYAYARPPRELETIFEGSHLRVFVPAVRYLLALKIFAAREDRDFQDVLLLAQKLGIQSEKELEEAFGRVFPASYLDERRRLFIKEVARVLPKRQKKFDLPALASLLEEDLERKWRYILVFVNKILWIQSRKKIYDLLSEPETFDPRVKAICASLAEWLASKKGLTPPAWTEKVGPSPEAVYLLPLKTRRLVMKAFIRSPVAFRKRHIFIDSLEGAV
ncbi:MAG: hypothetical protein GXO20_04945 [Thermodesulfobacteria bacterium]|nr:hypothetical protein [Thermodesulfobacteriota bacterium]